VLSDGLALIDIVFFLILIICMVRGGMRGFIFEVSAVAAPLLGILAAVLFSNLLAEVVALITEAKESIWNHIIAFLVIFLAVYLLIFFIQGFLQNIISKLNLDNLDRVLGGILGLVEGILVIAIILILCQWIPLEGLHQSLKGSLFFTILNPFLPSIPDIFKLIPLREACLKI
jgi:membrane protein required for colicin V production